MTDAEYIRLGAVALTVLLAVFGGYWALTKLIVKQFEEKLDIRFRALDDARRAGSEAQAQRFANLEATVRAVEARNSELGRDFTESQVMLSQRYLNRDDWVRFAASTDMKLDSIRADINSLARLNRS